MHELIIFAFYMSLVNQPLMGAEVIPTKNDYFIPPTIAAAEFSSLAACEAAATKTIAAMRTLANPLILNVGYTCNKKST